VEYLHFLLSEINRIKLDWEISEDEIKLFNNELERFKNLVATSDEVSIKTKESISNLPLIKKSKSINLKSVFQNIALGHTRGYDPNQIEIKEIVEALGEEIKRILNQLKYLPE
jgi:hypothetical protein